MRERKRKNFSQGYRSNFFVGRASIIMISIALIFMFGILYISGSNTLAAKSDTLSDLEKQKQELQVEKDRLEIEAARLQSIQEIQKTSDAGSQSKFVQTKKVNYLPSASVALK